MLDQSIIHGIACILYSSIATFYSLLLKLGMRALATDFNFWDQSLIIIRVCVQKDTLNEKWAVNLKVGGLFFLFFGGKAVWPSVADVILPGCLVF